MPAASSSWYGRYRIVFLLFVLSGATSLVYEVLWLRQLILIFGSTQFATSTILSTFMAGLALGAFIGGRTLTGRRLSPLAVYGTLEIGIGIYALLVPWLFDQLSPVYRALWEAGASESFLLLSLAKFAGIAAVLLPPTVLMGASLPVLARQVADDPLRIGGHVGLLYAVNTCGAVLGTFFAGFVAIPRMGMQRTLWTTAATSLALGIAACLVSRGYGRTTPLAAAEPPPPSSGPAAPSPMRLRLVLLAFGLSGFGALVLEVAWTRVLALVMGSSVYAFSLMLLAFLIGLAAGGAAFASILRRRPLVDPRSLLAWLLLAAGLLAYATTYAFHALPSLFAWIFFSLSPGPNGWFVVQLCFGLLIMFPATFALGGIFPVVLQLHARDLERVGGSVGTVYASNTAGTIAGAAAAGFVLIPILGVLRAVVAVAVLEIVLALLVAATAGGARRSRLAVAAIAGPALLLVLLVTPGWDVRLMNSGVYMNLFDLESEEGWQDFKDKIYNNNDVVYAAEGITATVFVADQPEYDNRYLSVNGKIEASTSADLETQLMCAHLPLLLHENPRDVLVVGLASGISVGAAASHPVRSIRVVEIEKAMIPAARLFADANRNVLDDPRVRISINDARNELEFSPATYDVIVNEPSNPWMTVASNLFTEEFFRMARTRVRPGGIFSQWIQTYYLPPEDLRSIVAAFQSAFPHVMMFETLYGIDLLLLGSEAPIELDRERIEKSMGQLDVRMDLARIGMRSPLDVLSLFRLGPSEVTSLVEGAGRNTDDNARVEFSAPRTLGMNTTRANLDMLYRHRADPLRYLRPQPVAREELDRIWLHLAEAWYSRGDYALAEESVEQVSEGPLRARADEIRRALRSVSQKNL